jgi:integrase
MKINEYLTIGADGRWLIRFTYDDQGQPRDRRFRLDRAHTGRGRPPRGSTTETTAREEMARRRAEIEAEVGFTPAERRLRKSTTVEDLALAWLEDAGKSTGSPWTPATERDYRSILGQLPGGGGGHLLPVLGRYPVSELTPEIARAWWRGLDRIGARTGNKAITVLRRVLNWANEDGRWGKVEDPTFGIRKRKQTDRSSEAVGFFEPEEVARILDAAERCHESSRYTGPDQPSALDRDVFGLIAHTGLRRGEVLALRVGDVDLGAEPSLTLRRAISAGEMSTTKSKRNRRIPLTADAVEILERRCEGRKPTELVFPGRGGHPMDGDALGRRFIRARDTAGLKDTDLTLHDLRHTFGSLLARAGYGAVEIQQLLGHSDLQVTQRYLHHRPRTGDAERLTRALGGEAGRRLRAVA